MVSLNVNGKSYQADVDPRTPLLWVLRDATAMVARELISISNSPPPCLRAHSIAGRQH